MPSEEEKTELTMEAQWEEFVKMVFPNDIPVRQHVDLKRTFYAGAYAFNHLAVLASLQTASMNEAYEKVQTVLDEVNKFMNSVQHENRFLN